ncbi:MAG: hypothetical protein P8Z67_03520 [Gammaproteobacteria bacterium]
MKRTFIKAGALLATVAVLGLIYFTVTSSAGKTPTKQAVAVKTTQHKWQIAHKPTVARSTRHKHQILEKHPASVHLAKSKPMSIKPVTALRKSEHAPHFGPPSKMYGGL